MKVCHIALGGCLAAGKVNYGLTEDTGGHIAYVLGAAHAQAKRDDVTEVQIFTRLFEDPSLGREYALAHQIVAPKLSIRRLRTGATAYLTKEALANEIPALTEAFLAQVRQMRVRPDVIHAHFADAARLALAAKEEFGIPVIYTPHSLALSKSGGHAAHQRVEDERHALARSDATVVSSRDEADGQILAYGAGLQARAHCIPPGVTVAHRPDPEGAAALLSPYLDDPRKPIILAIARPVRRKNLRMLAQVYANSATLQDAANLVILAGQHEAAAAENTEIRDELAVLKDTLRQVCKDRRAALPATHTGDDVSALYDWAARTGGIFVNVAIHEPFGLTLLEAASHGLPVVATCKGGPNDIVAALECGTCVDPTAADRIEDALIHLLKDRAAWRLASTAGKSRIGRYSWDAWATSVAGICRSIIRDRRPPPHRAAPFLLASDIDGTLTGCMHAAARFSGWLADRTDSAIFAVATGRSISEARRVLAQWALPEPEAFITSVGTEIYHRIGTGDLMLDRDYAAFIEQGWDRAGIHAALLDFDFDFQPSIEQRAWKLSGYGPDKTAKRLRRHLARRGHDAKVVASHDYLIDVLPPLAGKASAVAALAKRFGMTESRVIVAGDSGNDIDMFQAISPNPAGGAGIGHGIVVANASKDLLDSLTPGAFYGSGDRFADGVIDGLVHFGFGTATQSFRGAVE